MNLYGARRDIPEYDFLLHAVWPTQESPYLLFLPRATLFDACVFLPTVFFPAATFLPVVRLYEVPLAISFLPAATSLAISFLPAAIFFGAAFFVAVFLTATAFFRGTVFFAAPLRDEAVLVFRFTDVAPRVVAVVRDDAGRRRLVTTLKVPGPGMRLVSPPLSHRTVIMSPRTAVTTPNRGAPLDVVSIRSPTTAILISLTGRSTHHDISLGDVLSNRSLVWVITVSEVPLERATGALFFERRPSVRTGIAARSQGLGAKWQGSLNSEGFSNQ